MVRREIMPYGYLQEEYLDGDEALTEGNQQLLRKKGLVFDYVVQQCLKEVFLDDYNEDDDGEDAASAEGVISSGQLLLKDRVN